MLKRTMVAAMIAVAPVIVSVVPEAAAFCGFYVGKADSSLFNEASQVILVRDGDRTTISMLNDYRGELTDFALVVPVPVVLKREQVAVIRKFIFDRLDVFSAPRLVEYHDDDPCRRVDDNAVAAPPPAPAMGGGSIAPRRRGVTVEQSFTVGEYDIVILSAKESDGLEAWLTENGYRIPKGAATALKPYILQGMKFFVARVNLKEQAKTGSQYLRPLQFSLESAKFMLPMRLGMINGTGKQNLIVYVLTRKGRVESTNYRTVKIPADTDLPVFLKTPGTFKEFYKAMFDRQAERGGYKTVFTEYFWDMSWCDPCAADPLDNDELKEAGAHWVPDLTIPAGRRTTPWPAGGPPKVMLTRLHLRYTPATFPEDLAFQETGDRDNFQARYVLRHPWKGSAGACPAAFDYYREVARREAKQARLLSELTGWDPSSIRRRIPDRDQELEEERRRNNP